MKSKTLISLAVASTFGWSAGAFAGSSHEVVTPLSVSESGEVIAQNPAHKGFSGQQFDMVALGATSDSGSGTIGGSFSDSHAFSSDYSFSSDHSASLSMEESLAAADDGIYSDYYLVSYTPVETWYVIGDDQLAWSDDSLFLMPTHELALVPIGSDEMTYDLVLTPIAYDTVYFIESGGDTGE